MYEMKDLEFEQRYKLISEFIFELSNVHTCQNENFVEFGLMDKIVPKNL